jgi:hypothetical protein
MRHTSPSRKLLTAAVVLTLGLAACGDDNNGPNNPGGNPGGDTPGAGENGGLSTAQVQSIGAAVSEELDESFAAVVAVSPANPFERIEGFDFAGRVPACATTNPETPEDPDADQVPTTLTLTFEDCSRTGPNGASLDLFGSLTVADPSPDEAGIAVSLTADELGFEHTRASGGETVRVTRDGTRSLTGGATGISASEELVSTRQVGGDDALRITKDGTRTFTPDEGQTIVPGEERPSGTITIDGSLTWEQGEDTFNFTAQTLTPLHYDATCTDQPRGKRIDAGVLQYTRTFDGATESIKLTFTACGTAPTVEYVPAE